LPEKSVDNLLPLWMMLGYVGLSLGAIWSRKLFYGVLGVAVGYMGYLFFL
jgi:hypothetical protein